MYVMINLENIYDKIKQILLIIKINISILKIINCKNYQ